MFAWLCGLAQLPNEAGGDGIGIAQVMRPESDNVPARFTKRFCAQPVTGDVSFKFWNPV